MDMSTNKINDQISQFFKVKIAEAFIAQAKKNDDIIVEFWLKKHLATIDTKDINALLSENDVKAASVIRYFVQKLSKSLSLKKKTQSRSVGISHIKPGLDYYDHLMERGRSTSLQANMGQWNPNMLNA